MPTTTTSLPLPPKREETVNKVDAAGLSKISDSPSLLGSNATATDEIPTAVAATTATMSTLFFAVLALYILLSLLYMLQNRIPKLIRCCFGKRTKKTISPQNHNSTLHQYSHLRRIPFYCSQMIFTIRIFIFNCTRHHCHGGDTISRSHHELDGGKYQSWTVSQVTHWAYSQLQNQNNGVLLQTQIHESIASPIHSLSGIHSHAFREGHSYEDREGEFKQQRAIQTAIAELNRQRIDGRSLAYLTLDHLLNFGIAFGVAVHLMICLDELIPNRFALDEENTGDLPSWYESNEVAKSNHDESNEAAKNQYESSDGEQELVMAEKAQNIMKERFGMALPTIRGQNNASNHSDEEAQADLRSQNQQYPAEKPPQSQPLLTNNDKSALGEGGMHASSLSMGQHTAVEEMLNSMPPHVRAVAERRPELVSKLLLEKQHRKVHQQQTTTDLSTVSEEDSAYQSEEEINIDSESVSLLRRRIN
eukprot:CAMPEP_0201918018 /NCGR_PEP_ID=MMETSP0903-20130614/7265_1 /ASSEMBLY_ACC=CAM_ASM_000552 /TAXON_ID=420261 /ORGANISM="Thalassiosira antarctica, Strain CCMP982" /LENGTH=475 /DNA_ID=CAMNT_0048454209 /DNA_START=18 /DNA_END=1442 /DNA_ORIENTATION=+